MISSQIREQLMRRDTEAYDAASARLALDSRPNPAALHDKDWNPRPYLE